jgi:CDP-diacylglycerol---glycerol-3-phosphate 3-phosphatidyltransferase
VAGFLISYIKAKSEALGIECNGGLAERAERLIIIIASTGLTGLGVSFAMAIGLWVLALASLITIGQRLVIVHRGCK